MRVRNEWGAGIVTAWSPRRVVIELDAGDILNIVVGTPGYWRIEEET
jgi:uncharacterized cupin superfamily protein